MRHSSFQYVVPAACGLALLAASVAAAGQFPYCNPTLPIEDRIRDLLARMTVEEKVAQLVQVSAKGLEFTNGRATAESLDEG